MLTSRSLVQGYLIRWLLLLALITLPACQADGTAQVTPPAEPTERVVSQTVTYAEITFEAQLPEPLADGQNLFIEFLDEVTGLAMNPARAQMQSNDRQYFGIKIPIPVGSVVKYRYFRDNDPIGVEYTTDNQPVRYRLYVVEGPGVVYDTVAAWRSLPSQAPLGRIQGQAANATNNAPVVNALVTAGGVYTLTSSDGSFVLEGLPPANHNLVIYSLDGAFQPFQQGAVVASDSTTPALVKLNPARLVDITFVVSLPEETPENAPLRLVGNTYPLGNTFADLEGGLSVVAARAPLMQRMPDGRYTLSLQLPAGQDVRYKYSLGDGFWNAERGASGEVVLRQLIVPGKKTIIEDRIATWRTPDRAPVTFTVQVPSNTPAADTVSIQFNPFGWTQPIPMWPDGQNQWRYVLYSPLNLFDSAAYRYCRNDQCGVADASDSRGASAQGKPFQPTDEEQTFADEVEAWAWSEAPGGPVVVSASPVTPRDNNFQAGVEWMPLSRPTWQPYLPQAFQNIRNLGANTVMLTPTWHVTHQNPPVMAPVPGYDPLWLDLSGMIRQAQQAGLKAALHPVLRYNVSPNDWWNSAARDEGWWQTWFARYQTFALYHADLATQTGIDVLVLGDETTLPALPGGLLSDGQPSNVPADAELRWRMLVAAVRSRYSGKLVWMLPYQGALPQTPDFFSDVDMVYVQVNPPLMEGDDVSVLDSAVSAIFDGDLLSLQEAANKPILLGLQVPSVSGALDNCIGMEGSCETAVPYQTPGYEPISGASSALEQQAAAYSAFLSAVNQRSWISGFYASGYYPPAEITDLSVSVRGKPASDVLLYWYPRLLGQINP